MEDQNLKGRTSSWGLLVRKSSLLSKFVFLFFRALIEILLIILHKRSAENFFCKIVAANKGLLSSYSSKCFFGIMSKTVLVVVVFVLLPQKTFKIFSKILGMLRDSWQDLNPSIVIKIMYSSESEPFIVTSKASFAIVGSWTLS